MNRNRGIRLPNLFTIIILLLCVAFFIIGNLFFAGSSDTIGLSDGKDWERVSYEVIKGNADQFKAELLGPQKVKITYRGNDASNIEAMITLKDPEGTEYTYRYYTYEEYVGNDLQTQYSFELIGDH